MIEELLQAARVVFLIDALPQAVPLAVVVEHVNLFTEAAQREVELDALIPRYRVVFVVVNHQQRRLHAISTEDRRVLQKTHRVLPKASADPRLRVLVLKLTRET